MLNHIKFKLKRKLSFTRFRDETEGSTSLMFAGSIATLSLGVAISIDMSSTFSAKSKMQDALDSAVLSAAINVDMENFSEYGEQVYSANILGSGIENSALTFEKTSQQNSDKLMATASGTAPLIFASLLNKDGLDITVRSVAKVQLEPPSMADAVQSDVQASCVMALSKTAWSGLTINSGGTISGPGCEMQVHSVQSRAMTANAGINIDLEKICVAGSGMTDNSQGQIGKVELNCEVKPDPYANKIPEPTNASCEHWSGNYDRAPGNKITMQPGVYCGWHNFNNANIGVDFEPGLYVIRNGGWNVNGGNWSGDGVTFYMYDNSNLNFNSEVKAKFTAPKSGDYANIFITERATQSTRRYNLNSSSHFDFEGVVYLPNTRLTLNSGSNLVVRKMQLIADTIMLNGAIGLDASGIPSSAIETDVAAAMDETKTFPYLAD